MRPNTPEHPRNYEDEGPRLWDKVNDGKVNTGSLSARQVGLLAFWCPNSFFPDGGEVGNEGVPEGIVMSQSNPEHPRYYEHEARRLWDEVDDGRFNHGSLSARQYGLLAFWYPNSFLSYGDDSP